MPNKIKRNILNLFLKLINKSLKIKMAKILVKFSRSLVESYFYSYANPKINGEFYWLKKNKLKLNTIVDAGANKGDWIDFLVESFATIKNIILIEPNIDLVNLLEKKYRKDNRIKISGVALDYRKDELFLNIEDQKLSQATVSNISKDKVNNLFTSKKIKTECLDTILSKYINSSIDLLKIDIEGFEHYALLGLRNSLTNNKVKIIQFEVTSSWETSGCSPCSTFRYLSNNNFIIYYIDTNGLKKINEIELIPHFSIYSNFLAIHKTVINQFNKEVFLCEI